jgi:hypothetical protein
MTVLVQERAFTNDALLNTQLDLPARDLPLPLASLCMLDHDYLVGILRKFSDHAKRLGSTKL